MHMYSVFLHFRLLLYVIFAITNLQPYCKYVYDLSPALVTLM